MKKTQFFFVCAFVISFNHGFAQQSLGDNLGNHKATLALKLNANDIKNVNVLNSTGLVVGSANSLGANISLRLDGLNKALLVTRVTDLLSTVVPPIPEVNAVDGMLVYDLATSKFYVRQNSAWVSFAFPDLAPGQMLIGDGAGKAHSITMTGDITINSTGVVSITDNSITTNKILNASVTGSKIADSAIVTAKIVDLTITNSNLAPLSVSADKIVPGINGELLITNAASNVAWEVVPKGIGYEIGDIKPYIDVLGEGIPVGWVACSGQTLSDAASTLNGRVLPNLNSGSYPVGGALAASGVSVGSNTLNISSTQLPAITITATSVTSTSGGTPEGTVTVNQDGAHSMSYNDRYFQEGGTNYNNGSTTAGYPGNNVDQNRYSQLSTGTEHNHTATFTGNALSTHTHTVSVPLNETGVQVPLNIQPKSVVVTWIMRIK